MDRRQWEIMLYNRRQTENVNVLCAQGALDLKFKFQFTM